MPDKLTCPECGAELPANAPQGLCPQCLAKMGLGLLPNSAQTESDFQIERTGVMIGRYKLLEKIGEGGFGVVFMAEQVEPVQRKVALKIIKAGMDTKEVIARFEAERQAIALMDHPNIARALDAGATEAGRPYFVMELVRGIPITDYCDQANLPTRERLQLFTKVCQAVQHAHQKGVIHRDIKPSNVLVTEHDGEPVPKVIDFGVAKALGQKLTEKTLFTAFHHLIGTPAYMSPEQAALSGLDIDTRADIYSLGVLLYELLTGVPPFDGENFRKAALDEIRRMIQETEPLKPSTRLQTLGDKLDGVAKHRGTLPASLTRLIRGDLDWVVMRCLEKDRQRRYETANGLAADLERHLNSEPILACPPSGLYRFQKLIRRHKLAFTAASAVLCSLIIGLGLFAWERWQAVTARERAALALGREAEARAQADRALNQIEIQRAEDLFSSGDGPWALAYLVRVLRRDPSNEVAATRLLSALARRTFVMPSTNVEKAPIWSSEFSPHGRRITELNVIKEAGSMVWYAGTNPPPRTRAVEEALIQEPLTALLRHESEVRSARFSPDGREIITASVDWTARVWEAYTSKPTGVAMEHKSGVRYAEFGPDGRLAVTASYDNTARLWNSLTGEPLTEPLKHRAWCLSAHFSPDGRRFVTTTGAKMAILWDTATGKPLGEPLRHADQVWCARFSPDGNRVLTVSFDNTACIWETRSGKLLTKLVGHSDRVWSGDFSPDGRKVATASFDGSARIWDAQTGAELVVLSHEGAVWSVQFSPDSQKLLTASLDQTARVWDVDTGLPLTEPLKHSGAVWSAQFSPDGRRVVTASQDTTARVWDAVSGFPVSEPLNHKGAVFSAQFSPDGQRVVTASADGTARIWELPTVALPVPEWISSLAEAVAGKRFNDLNIAEVVPFAQPEAWRQRLSVTNASDVWTRWAKWFFDEPATRNISPFSTMTVTEYVQRRVEENTLAGLKEAVTLSPANGLALARLARALLAANQDHRPDEIAEADKDSLLATSAAPNEAETWWARAEVLERMGRLAEALDNIQTAIRFQADLPELWRAHGRMLEKTNRDEEALRSFSRAIELANAKGRRGRDLAGFYLDRFHFLFKQNRLADAGVDRCLALSIPVRDPQTDSMMIDLSAYYNAPLTEGWQTETSDNDLSELPRGIQTLAGAPFDVRGLIQVGTASRTEQPYPTAVTNIVINRVCSRLEFLHAAIESDDVVASTPNSTLIGSYVIHYADGEAVEIPIVTGQALLNWFTEPAQSEKSLTVAWVGESAQSRRRGKKVRLYKSTWQNPKPDAIVSSLDFNSLRPESPWPFLVALTAK